MGGTSTKISSSEEEYQSTVRTFEEKFNLEHEHRKLLKESVVLPCSVAELPENTRKNRHLNECFDYNRVIVPERDGSDFINASWVDGYKAPGKFLLCQAPLRETVQDWWAMVLANKIRVIVMLTRIVERDLEACFPYWSQEKEKSSELPPNRRKLWFINKSYELI
ncbi:receptor-type tyrosine-protein phosphatase epsilon-like [Cydia pomonella]|uniref:receptor-type tyrosine-protein phosphatase epsilon-like n=1 Tax=Cydia pomonella TaxID=82600 RepID=UPI002ADE1D9D|nr:receptor-type tyrosine-protein phosphatase epsilon-like [Cydia pomonella]